MAIKSADIWRSKLESHKRVRKLLISPFMQMGVPTEQVYWWRDFLPEFLWIDSLVSFYGDAMAVQVFSNFLSAADRFNKHTEEILDGTVSSFRLIPEDQRLAFREQLAPEIKRAIEHPFGVALNLSSECPMAWLSNNSTLDRNAGIVYVREALERLFPGKDDHAGLCRALPLHRMFAHNKVFIADTLTEVIEAIKQYPAGDRWLVESFARQVHTTTLLQKVADEPDRLDWSRSFWNANLFLTPCRYG